MPGTPDPVLGSSLATHAVGGGAAYATLSLLLWFAVRVATDEFARLSIPPAPTFAAVVLASGAVLFAHTALSLVLYRRAGYLTPLLVLFGATEFAVWLFLHVSGETDPIGLYWLVFGPVVLAAVLALAGVEYGVRRLLGVGD